MRPLTSDLTHTHDRSRTRVAMDTLVSVRALSANAPDAIDAVLERAIAWFATVERACSRFDPESQLVQLCRRTDEAVPVSDLLFEAVAFALRVAQLTNGAFDPTVGGAQQRRGFTRSYRDGWELPASPERGSYRDVRLDRRARTIRLTRPLLLDLGAVAKGLAVDLAARELAGLERFAVDAGGDLYAGGAGPEAGWRIGVQHPVQDRLLGALTVQNLAVCTSGGGERPAQQPGEHHLLDPRSGRSPRELAGVTVVAPSAMLADALATAAFVLGAEAGGRLLEAQGVAGVLVTATDSVQVIHGQIGELSWSAWQE